MQAEVRSKLEMAERVSVFNEAHPDADPSYGSVRAAFDADRALAEELATRARNGAVERRAAVRRKAEARALLQRRLLAHLTRVTDAAAKERPDLVGRFRLPTTTRAIKPFMIAARAIVAEAEGLTVLLAKYGMSDGMFRELSETLVELEAATIRARAARLAHVGANAELLVVAGGLVDHVRRLDGLNQARFRNDPDVLAEWNSARAVVVTRRGGKRQPPAAGDGLAPAA